MRDRFAGVQREVAQQLVLGRAQLDNAAGGLHRTTSQVYLEVSQVDDRLACRNVRLTAKHRFDPRNQLVSAEWFDDVVVGAGVEGAHLVLLAGHHAHDNHSRTRRWAQRAQRREPVHPWQPEVEQDYIGSPGGRFANSLLPAPYRPNVEVVVLQPGAKCTLHLDLVVDDQDASRHQRGAVTRARGSVKVKRGPRLRFSA